MASGSFSDEDFRQWLRVERNSRGWNREQLSREIARSTSSSLSASSIAKVEQGSMSPLGKTKGLIYATLGEPSTQVSESEYPTIQHIWTDGYDVHHLYSEMIAKLRSGTVEYEISPVYFSLPAYTSYMQSANSGLQLDIISARDAMLRQLLKSIYPDLGGIYGIDIVSLSVGYGWSEIDIAIQLELISQKPVSLFMISSSISVINEARRQLMMRINSIRGIKLYTVSCTHESLQYINKSIIVNQQRKRIIILPSVLANHEADVKLWDSLSVFAKSGDMLIADMPLISGKIEEPKTIIDSDPRLNGSISNHPHSGFLHSMTIGIQEYGLFTDIASHDTQIEFLRPSRSLSSYVVSHFIDFVPKSGVPERICDLRFLRYELERIMSYLRQKQWILLGQWTFGREIDPYYPFALLLIKKL